MNVARKQPVLQGMRECFSRSVLSCQFAESLHEFSSKQLATRALHCPAVFSGDSMYEDGRKKMFLPSSRSGRSIVFFVGGIHCIHHGDPQAAFFQRTDSANCNTSG